MIHRALSRAALAALLTLATAVLPLRASADDLLVFAAASLKPALDEIIAAPDANAVCDAKGCEIKASYAASSQLEHQIEAGAPASLFVSADQDWMNAAEAKGRIVRETRVDLLGNALVLVAPKDSKLALSIAPNLDLVGALGKDGRIALGEPNSVPAGKYAKASLTSLGVWDSLGSRIVSADNVRAALNFVAKGEAPLGVVYRSDAVSEPAVRVVDTFPETSHASIVYPAAIVTDHDTPAARKLLALLRAPSSQAIFTRYGFDAPAKR
jgi:molybdate transport system substrate-binding protein